MAKAPQDTESRHADKYIVRFPEGMRDRLKRAAASNNRTLNAEIISRLDKSFDAEVFREPLEIERLMSLAASRVKIESLTVQRGTLGRAVLTFLEWLKSGSTNRDELKGLESLQKFATYASEEARRESPEGLIEELIDATERQEKFESRFEPRPGLGGLTRASLLSAFAREKSRRLEPGSSAVPNRIESDPETSDPTPKVDRLPMGLKSSAARAKKSTDG